jgi:hypothetical protein
MPETHVSAEWVESALRDREARESLRTLVLTLFPDAEQITVVARLADGTQGILRLPAAWQSGGG